MNTLLNNHLRMLEVKHSPEKAAANTKRLRVFYGWCKLGKIRKREGISIIYENQEGAADHHRMNRAFLAAQYNVCWRYQTEGEANDAKQHIHIFTEYCVFMDDPHVRGSLDAALLQNSLDDQKNVSAAERNRIAEALREWYMSKHRDYKEPGRQLELFD